MIGLPNNLSVVAHKLLTVHSYIVNQADMII